MKDKILRACEYIEKVRSELYSAYHDIVDEELKSADICVEPLPQEKWEVECNDDVIKIYIPDYLPKRNSITKEIYNMWLKNLVCSLQSIIPTPQFEKIFVYIKMFIPGSLWDVDNRSIKMIIDSIRYSKIIKDDSFQYVAYGAEGSNKEPYHTEIYIMDYSKMPYILPAIALK